MNDRRPSPLYRLGLVLVALATLVLPVLYVGLTALAAYGVYYFGANHFPTIWAWHIPSYKVSLLVKVFCSVTPLLVGATVAFFMVKPLFARREPRPAALALNPEMEPRVFALVGEICRVVGAPTPRRIELNCEVNASARFDRGVRGFLGRGNLVLTLGMPLVGGLTERELAGVIAHEFGHFRQGGGMRLSYVVRSINGWFARVIYGRDSWDERLADWAGQAEGHWMLAIMLFCANLGVGISRGVLWLLMMAGHGVGCLLLRQMEYDADRAEVHVAGSAAFESTMNRLAVLGATLGETQRELARTWQKRFQLPDNLPALVTVRAGRMPAEKRARLENELSAAKTGLFDTHPSPGDRITRARALAGSGAEGIGDGPARGLFENFENLGRLVTLAHYEDDLKVPVTPDFLIPMEGLLGAVDGPVAATAPTTPAPVSAPAAAPVLPPVRMVPFNPEAFRGKTPPPAGGMGDTPPVPG